jgi:hypothetical protein|nr:MAG TPA: hypothetical protein [Caudoviricetes sp.]
MAFGDNVTVQVLPKKLTKKIASELSQNNYVLCNKVGNVYFHDGYPLQQKVTNVEYIEADKIIKMTFSASIEDVLFPACVVQFKKGGDTYFFRIVKVPSNTEVHFIAHKSYRELLFKDTVNTNIVGANVSIPSLDIKASTTYPATDNKNLSLNVLRLDIGNGKYKEAGYTNQSTAEGTLIIGSPVGFHAFSSTNLYFSLYAVNKTTISFSVKNTSIYNKDVFFFLKEWYANNEASSVNDAYGASWYRNTNYMPVKRTKNLADSFLMCKCASSFNNMPYYQDAKTTWAEAWFQAIPIQANDNTNLGMPYQVPGVVKFFTIEKEVLDGIEEMHWKNDNVIFNMGLPFYFLSPFILSLNDADWNLKLLERELEHTWR